MSESTKTAPPIEAIEPLSCAPSVFIVDDCSETLTLHEIVLGQAGYKVFTVNSGQRAVQLLGQIDRPQLILLDLNLGDMNGLELIDLIEDRYPEIFKYVPIVFLSGTDQVPESKAIGFIRKPVDIDQLIKHVRDFIKSRD
jgi:CheY-like chemotaxis protein